MVSLIRKKANLIRQVLKDFFHFEITGIYVYIYTNIRKIGYE